MPQTKRTKTNNAQPRRRTTTTKPPSAAVGGAGGTLRNERGSLLAIDPQSVPVDQLDACIAAKRTELWAAFARDPRFIGWVFDVERGDEIYTELSTLLLRRECLRVG